MNKHRFALIIEEVEEVKIGQNLSIPSVKKGEELFVSSIKEDGTLIGLRQDVSDFNRYRIPKGKYEIFYKIIE